MPTKSERTSGEGSASRGGSSVYDFLYYDAGRIDSFLAQLGHYGSPGKVTHRQQSSERSRDATTGKMSGGVPSVASGEATVENERGIDYNTSLEQEYDPLWISGLNLHDDLRERGHVKSELLSARIGDFIDVQGALSLIDFVIFQGLWSKPSIQALIQAGIDNANPQPELAVATNRQDRRRRDRETPSRTGTAPTTGDLLGDLMTAIPHPLQARLLTEQRQAAWVSLKRGSLVIEASDVLLKHGIVLDGRWRIFGVLDALPNSNVTDALKADLADAIASVPFGQMAQGLQPMVQAGLGRQTTAWGVTPIMIFRELTAS